MHFPNIRIVDESDSADAYRVIKREENSEIGVPNTPLTVQYNNLVSSSMTDIDNLNYLLQNKIAKRQLKNNNNESSSSDSGYKSKASQKTKVTLKPGVSDDPKLRTTLDWQDDDTHMYADIEPCDTLFLDIGTKEPPELMAARSIKGKLKKKKVVRQKSKSSEDVEKSGATKTSLSPGSDVAVSLEKGNDETGEPTIKVKKKIKIIIGKKTRGKITRKKSIPD